MDDCNKKRNNSFRRLFPFFSKSKDKNKDTHTRYKKHTEIRFSNNQYHDPRAITAIDKRLRYTDNDERIYENLTVHVQSDNDNPNIEILTDHSSSSTLVSENVKNRTVSSNEDSGILNYKHEPTYRVGPQVPTKPSNELMKIQNPKTSDHPQYPDVYYHSIEKLIEPATAVDVSRTSQNSPSINLTSVGAEIKKVSTKFLISPKKEAEVRTIQPTRARSLSFGNNSVKLNENLASSEKSFDNEKPTKSYNYSAPTSPIPVNNKVPNMPKTVSPYGHVRKNMIESEEKSNSLGRTNLSSPSRSLSRQSKTLTPVPTQETIATLEKEKTRKRVEAFYWQKLKEIKEKEDEYYLQQALNSSLKSFSIKPNCGGSAYSTHSFSVEPRSSSLPRGVDFQKYSVHKDPDRAFVRGAPERRTDSFIVKRNMFRDTDIVYRNPEKYKERPPSSVPLLDHILRLNATQETVGLQPKRVSFEEQLLQNGGIDSKKDFASGKLDEHRLQNMNYTNNMTVQNAKGVLKCPPRPPVRTTSVGNYRVLHNKMNPGVFTVYTESESGSEAGEIQKIMQNTAKNQEDWHGDGSRVDAGQSDGEGGRAPSRGRSSRREDPRRHTLTGNHLCVHPHGYAGSNEMEQFRNRKGCLTPEYATVVKYRDLRNLDPRLQKPPLPRGYAPASNALLFDEDPGIMSEVETASTGFRRGGKQRSSLPVVRTPSKTLERPLGLVFLQYRNETKRSLLPNEITSLDTVKALFVRSFPKQLTMQYMDSPVVKIYIHDSSKDMFYELEDLRPHLRDIKDRTVLRLFEATDISGGIFPGTLGAGSIVVPSGVPAIACSGPASFDQDQSYFSEPEIDSEYHHQHVHKSKVKAPSYYMGTAAPSTLPRGGSMLRAFSPAAPPVPADRVKPIAGAAHAADGYMSSPERGGPRISYEEPYYTQYLGPVPGRSTIAPIIDEEVSEVIIDDSYQMYGVNPLAAAPRPMPRPPYDARLGPVDEMQRLRVEKMERQLANLTGLVQKALQVPGPSGAQPVSPRPEFQTYGTRPNQDAARYGRELNDRPPKLGRDKFQKSVSFEKSVSFSDEPPNLNSPKQHSPQHSADTKPTKPAIKSSTLPRTSSQERDRLKPAPPPKPAGLAGQPLVLVPQKSFTITVTPEFYGQLHILQRQSLDLRLETNNLRRSTLSHAMQMRQMMADAIVQIGNLAADVCDEEPGSLTREEEAYRQDMLMLENDLYDLEATVERLRGQAANSDVQALSTREMRVNMADIEGIAKVLSKSSKTVADWKLKFPILQATMKMKLSSDMDKIVRKEKMLEEQPERLELALRRCKKLTGTLVTLKRLACVQEQRLPLIEGRVSPGSSNSTLTGISSVELNSDSNSHLPPQHNKGGGPRAGSGRGEQRPENALDALLDELQTFSKPGAREPPLRRLHSYPSGSDTDASPPVRARGHHPPKPPIPERHPELLAMAARRAPPPPPPRTTSRSPLASPTSPLSPDDDHSRQHQLEHRHQELLKKQKALQEQYARLQMIQRSGPALPPNAQPNDLKKTGSESNLLTKMNLNLSAAAVTGSMNNLSGEAEHPHSPAQERHPEITGAATTNKVYETDIL